MTIRSVQRYCPELSNALKPNEFVGGCGILTERPRISHPPGRKILAALGENVTTVWSPDLNAKSPHRSATPTLIQPGFLFVRRSVLGEALSLPHYQHDSGNTL